MPRWLTGLLFLLSLALLLAHAASYWFLTDDAFISFRYARNLANGDGLVFNPGLERVEGYTNFSWVVWLALWQLLGVAPEAMAPVTSLLLTAGLWGLLAHDGLSREREADPRWALLPLLCLAATRSIAVWSTGGLETRLFEFCVVAGVLRLAHELRALESDSGGASPRPWAALAFAAACLTRPDGLLIAASCLSVAALWPRAQGKAMRAWRVASALRFAALVGPHFIWRKLYYGVWLPNTYYAKVGGELRWEQGFDYLQAFALEYAAWLWLPFFGAALIAASRRGAWIRPALFGAAVLPHALYVASIGGDHFEYRPLDLYFPFVFILIGTGARELADRPKGRPWVLAGLAALLVGLWELPRQSRVQYDTRQYSSGFPGLAMGHSPEAEAFLDPSRSLVYRWPLLRAFAERHRELLRRNTASFVGNRAEEHRMFFERVDAEGRALAGLVEAGHLPNDTFIAIDCVGAIPYRSDLPTLDRLGLTDAEVARGAFVGDLLAHGKRATPQYAAQRGVELWAGGNVSLLRPLDPPRVAQELMMWSQHPQEHHFAVIEGWVLIAWLPQGLAHARERFPALDWYSARDRGAIERLARLGAAGARP